METSNWTKTVFQQSGGLMLIKRQGIKLSRILTYQFRNLSMPFSHYAREALESVLALVSVVLLSLFAPQGWLQGHLIFYAFFLVVFAIAIRYSVVTTYITGFLAAGCYSYILWHYTQLQLSIDTLQIFIEPFLLFVGGIIVSETLSTQRIRLKAAEQQVIHKESLLQDITERYQGTQTLNAELERQLGGQAALVATVSEKMARLWRLQGKEQQDAMLDLVMSVIDAQCCALYQFRHRQMSLCVRQQKETYANTNTVQLKLNVDDELINRVIQSRLVCTIHDILIDGKTAPQAGAVMAGPLIDSHNQVVGIIVVDDIPLLKFSPRTVRLFGSILNMISLALQTAIPVQGSKSGVLVPLIPDGEANALDVAGIEPVGTQDDNSMDDILTEYALPVLRSRKHASK